MTKKLLVGLCVCGLAVAVACSKSSNPVSPSSTAAAGKGAAADGSTLKVPAPTGLLPDGGVQLTTDTIVLTFNNVQGKYASFPITYEVQLFDAGGTLVSNPKFGAGSGATTSFTVTSQLTNDANF